MQNEYQSPIDAFIVWAWSLIRLPLGLLLIVLPFMSDHTTLDKAVVSLALGLWAVVPLIIRDIRNPRPKR